MSFIIYKYLSKYSILDRLIETLYNILYYIPYKVIQLFCLDTIYPLSSELSPMEFGDNENLQYAGNVVSVKRLVKCDFLSRFKVLDFKDDKKDLCINPNYKTWICKPFLLTRKDLEHNDYYLLFNNKIINSYWSISNPNNINEKEYLINTNVYKKVI